MACLKHPGPPVTSSAVPTAPTSRTPCCWHPEHASHSTSKAACRSSPAWPISLAQARVRVTPEPSSISASNIPCGEKKANKVPRVYCGDLFLFTSEAVAVESPAFLPSHYPGRTQPSPGELFQPSEHQF